MGGQVDRDAHGGDRSGGGRPVRQSHGVDAAGAGLLEELDALDGLRQWILEERRPVDQGVGAAVDDEVDAGLVRGRAGVRDVLGVLLAVAHPSVLTADGVLDIDAHGAGLQDALNELGGGHAVAGLHVDAHRQVDGGDDARRRPHVVVEVHRLPVTGAQRVAHGVAAHREPLESGGLREPGGPGVPHGGEDQQVPRLVRLSECRGLLLNV